MPLPSRLTFGPFEVDAEAQSLRKSGYPVRLTGQPFEILLALLESPGAPVSREQLRDRIWRDGTFVDFDHGLNAAVNRLRRALNDSAEAPRYIETIAGRGYRFIGVIDLPKAEVAEAPVISPPAPMSSAPEVLAAPVPPSHSRKPARWLWLLLPAGCIALAFWFHSGTQPRIPPASNIHRLTDTDGISTAPAISPDGKLVAYASDGGEDNGLDLYVRNVAGGKPIRLTSDGAENTTPDFSPDGSRIVFHSARDGGGIFEIPTLGGPVRQLAARGFRPKYSPDGTQVAYWIGAPSVAAALPGVSQIWVVPAAGGTPRRLDTGLTSASAPLWMPDGKSLLAVGYSSSKNFDPAGLDWWLLPVDGGKPIRTGARQAILRAGLPLYNSMTTPVMPVPGCWSASDGHLLFSALSGDTRNLWHIGISPLSGNPVRPPERLTAGSGDEMDPSCTGNKVVFWNSELRVDLWLFPASSAGKGKAVPQQVSHGRGIRESLSISRNGKYLAYTSDRADKPNIWVRDLSTGEESLMASSPVIQRYPLINEAGTRVLYSVFEGDTRALFMAAKGKPTERICEGCLRPTDWTRDESKVLVFGGSPYTINVLDLASRSQTALVRHPTESVLYGRFSPDYRWISFTARVSPAIGRIVVAPLDGLNPVSIASWISIADAGIDDYAMWSSDGRTLYYTSPRDGHLCLWGQKVDTVTGKPIGEPFGIRHFHGRPFLQHVGWSAGNGTLAIPLTEETGSVWMLSR